MKSLKTGRLSDVRVLFFNQIQNSNYNWGLNESNNILCIQEWLTAYQHSWNCCDLFISSKCSSFDLISINVIVCVCVLRSLSPTSAQSKLGMDRFLRIWIFVRLLSKQIDKWQQLHTKPKGKNVFFILGHFDPLLDPRPPLTLSISWNLHYTIERAHVSSCLFITLLGSSDLNNFFIHSNFSIASEWNISKKSNHNLNRKEWNPLSKQRRRRKSAVKCNTVWAGFFVYLRLTQSSFVRCYCLFFGFSFRRMCTPQLILRCARAVLLRFRLSTQHILSFSPVLFLRHKNIYYFHLKFFHVRPFHRFG